ncbi:MAG: GNAT family N-acetyltransferase [Anaerolineales bacterium]|jgi:ribosomal protein S18 acetylase RimI-like enzyme
MIRIDKLTQFDRKRYRELTAGYTSPEKYLVWKTETEDETYFTMKLQPLDRPYVKRFGQDDDLEDYLEGAVKQGLSLGAFDGKRLVGIAISEEREWNNSLWVWDFHIDAEYQRKGVGTKLMDAVIDQAKEKDFRVVVCETQNTNVPAIRFYRKLGFVVDGIDLTYYPEKEIAAGEVAIFMKRHLNR